MQTFLKLKVSTLFHLKRSALRLKQLKHSTAQIFRLLSMLCSGALNCLCLCHTYLMLLYIYVCVHSQDLLYVWTEPKLCVGGVTLPEKKTLPCEGMEFWVRLGAGLGVFTAVLLVSLTCYFWKKNKRYDFLHLPLCLLPSFHSVLFFYFTFLLPACIPS